MPVLPALFPSTLTTSATSGNDHLVLASIWMTLGAMGYSWPSWPWALASIRPSRSFTVAFELGSLLGPPIRSAELADSRSSLTHREGTESEFVALPAMSLPGIRRRRRNGGTHEVLSGRHRLQVRGIDAGPVSAQMVELQPGRNRATNKYVEQAMGLPVGPVVGKLAVATGQPSEPPPTSAWLDDDSRCQPGSEVMRVH